MYNKRIRFMSCPFCFAYVLYLFHSFDSFGITVMMKPMDARLRIVKVDYEGKKYGLSIKLRPATELIVFLHGWGGSKDGFDDAFSSNKLQGYGICAMDLLGFGKSEKPADFSY